MTRHILVVDDDHSVRLMLTRLLQTQGYRISAAPNVREARALVADNAFDLAVLDIVMPGESGLEFAAKLRETHSLPIVLISGYSTEDPVSFAADHRDVTFVPKPFSPDDLLGLIANMLPPES